VSTPPRLSKSRLLPYRRCPIALVDILLLAK
jgi:hypothetical protein